MSKFMGSKTMRAVVTVGMLAALAACGGGGGGDGGVLVSVKGTAATGAALPGATISMKCANGAVLSGVSDSTGAYAIGGTVIKYPCIGNATLGAVKYSGVLLQGTVANFTPLTEILTEIILSASVAGNGTAYTFDQFITRINSDANFAQAVILNAASYRQAVVTVVQNRLKAEGLSDSQIATTIAAIASGNVDSVTFAVGDAVDKVLDNTAAAILDASKNVDLSTQTVAKAEGDKKPTPVAGATGAAGTSTSGN